jgi:hypothetical protein
VLARRQLLRRFDVEVVNARQIVAVFQLAVLRVQAPAADICPLRDDDSFGIRFWNLDLARDGVGFGS